MLFRQPFTLLIHIALAIILAGAIVTHYCGIQGEVKLQENAQCTMYTVTSGPGDGCFPFEVRLEQADIDFYPGTTTPMDFRSTLDIDGKRVTVSMNRVAEVRGWRFFQTGIGPDGTTLSVSHDPWGTGITYTGYALLGIGFVGFFFQRKTAWRSLLRARPAAILLFASLSALSSQLSAETLGSQLPTYCMQRPLARNLGKVYVYWNDRVCPLQTMALDVTRKLYGSSTYQGLTADQVLSGWLFYFDVWERDYMAGFGDVPTSARKKKDYDERMGLMRWLGTGEAFRIYPYHAADGRMEWLSLTGRRPSKMPLEQWRFMTATMPHLKALLLRGRNIEANEMVSQLIAAQERYAGTDVLPSPARMAAERFYNTYVRLWVPALLALLAAVGFLLMNNEQLTMNNKLRAHRLSLLLFIVNCSLFIALAYVGGVLGLLWWIGGHAPLSNGPEMMLFMALVALLYACLIRKPGGRTGRASLRAADGHTYACAPSAAGGRTGRASLQSRDNSQLSTLNSQLKGACCLVAALTLAVALMGGSSPRIGMLMPVLASPLLSVHVLLVMTSYVLFLVMAVLAVAGLCARNPERQTAMCRYNRLILLPAVFLLGAGIFVGAVWANQSWGRYWGWDPKETCALVMLLVYSVPMHWGCRPLRCFRRPRVLQWYLLAAVLTVLFTYFGANYLLPGLHSYA